LSLAGHFGLDTYMLSLSSPDMYDERLFSDRAHTCPRSLLLLEDVDAVFRERRLEDENRSGVTFSGLLNAIDGVAAAVRAHYRHSHAQRVGFGFAPSKGG